MMRKLLAATALALVSAAPASAAQFSVQLGALSTGPVGLNYFSSALTDPVLGLGQFFVPGPGGITLTGPASVEFFYLGSESAYRNTFTAGTGSNSVTYTDPYMLPAPAPYQEIDDLLTGSIGALAAALGSNLVAAPGLSLGGVYYDGTDLSLGDWLFTNNDPVNGASAGVGDSGFGIFLPTAQLGNTTITTDWLVIGYDDQDLFDEDDDNHDDFILLARIAAVPESSTWAMLIAGFMTVGAALRRRTSGRKLIQAV